MIGCVTLTFLVQQWEVNMNSESKKTNDRTYDVEPKRPYHRPKLEVYGDLGSITGAVGGKGNLDGRGQEKTVV